MFLTPLFLFFSLHSCIRISPFTKGTEFLKHRTISIEVDQPPSGSVQVFFWVRLSNNPSGLYNLINLSSENVFGDKIFLETILSIGYFKSAEQDLGDDFCFELQKKTSKTCQKVDSLIQLHPINWTFVSVSVSSKIYGQLIIKKFDDNYVEFASSIKKASFNFKYLRSFQIEIGSADRPDDQSIYLFNGFITNNFNPEIDPRFFYLYSELHTIMLDTNFPQIASGIQNTRGFINMKLNSTQVSLEGLVFDSESDPIKIPDISLFKNENIIENVNFLIRFSFSLNQTDRITLMSLGKQKSPGYLSVSLAKREIGGVLQPHYSFELILVGEKYNERTLYFAPSFYPNKNYSVFFGLFVTQYGSTAYFLDSEDPRKDSDIQEVFSLVFPRRKENLFLIPHNLLATNDKVIFKRLVILDQPSAYIKARIRSLGVNPPISFDPRFHSTIKCMIPVIGEVEETCLVCPPNFVLSGTSCRKFCPFSFKPVGDECMRCKEGCISENVYFKFSKTSKNSFFALLSTPVNYSISEEAFNDSFCNPEINLPPRLFLLDVQKDFVNLRCSVEINPVIPFENVRVQMKLGNFSIFNNEKMELFFRPSNFTFDRLTPFDNFKNSKAFVMGVICVVLYYLGLLLMIASFFYWGDSFFYYSAIKITYFIKIFILAYSLTLLNFQESQYFIEIMIRWIILLWNDGFILNCSTMEKDLFHLEGTWMHSTFFYNNFLLTHIFQIIYLILYKFAQCWRRKRGANRFLDTVFSKHILYFIGMYFLPENAIFCFVSFSTNKFDTALDIFDFVITMISTKVLLLLVVLYFIVFLRSNEYILDKTVIKSQGFLYTHFNLNTRSRAHNPAIMILVGLICLLIGITRNGMAVSITLLSGFVIYAIAFELFHNSWKTRLSMWVMIAVSFLVIFASIVFLIRVFADREAFGIRRTGFGDNIFQISILLMAGAPILIVILIFYVRRFHMDFFLRNYEIVWRQFPVILTKNEKDVYYAWLKKENITKTFLKDSVNENGNAEEFAEFPILVCIKPSKQHLVAIANTKNNITKITMPTGVGGAGDSQGITVFGEHKNVIEESQPIKTDYFVKPHQGSVILSPRDFIIRPSFMEIKDEKIDESILAEGRPRNETLPNPDNVFLSRFSRVKMSLFSKVFTSNFPSQENHPPPL